MWIRGLLMVTCTGVSFAHGSNDGQKGMGLIMLILIGILPGIYALKMDASHAELQRVVVAADVLDDALEEHAQGSRPNEEEATKALAAYIKPGGQLSPLTYGAMDAVCDDLTARLKNVRSFANVPAEERGDIRTDLFLLLKSLDKLDGHSALAQPQLAEASQTLRKGGQSLTNQFRRG